ncbi:hypothetical protein AB0877_13905 [Micromonospora sp. NPDC047644]|uniref:hypothetical protein n=1 Tax=Micromonospora sp. NPDC047644 TaxID=3157203 RepID=UPI003455009A
MDEAIGAYNSGAYRSSVIALWIAVVADVIDKIRAMAEQGEKAACVLRDALTAAIDNNDVPTLQRLEGQLLEEAEKLQLFGKRECEELTRLKKDRNLCAHPAFVAEESLFSPSPELVRLHMQTAVDNLLSHGPVVGKIAIKRFEAEVLGYSFPSDDAKLKTYLWESYVQRGSDSFIRNFTKVLAKAALSADKDLEFRWRHVRSLRALYDFRPGDVEAELREFLRDRQLRFNEDELLRFVGSLLYIPCVPILLEAGTRHRIESLVQGRPVLDLLAREELFAVLPPRPYDGYLLARLPEAISKSNSSILGGTSTPDLRLFDMLLEEFRTAGSFPYCAAVAGWFTAMSPALTAEHVAKILETAKLNDQAYGSVLTNRELERLKWATTGHAGVPELFKAFDEWQEARLTPAAGAAESSGT